LYLKTSGIQGIFVQITHAKRNNRLNAIKRTNSIVYEDGYNGYKAFTCFHMVKNKKIGVYTTSPPKTSQNVYKYGFCGV